MERMWSLSVAWLWKWDKKLPNGGYEIIPFFGCFVATIFFSIRNSNPFVFQRILGYQSVKMINHYHQMNTQDLQQNIAINNPLEQYE